MNDLRSKLKSIGRPAWGVLRQVGIIIVVIVVAIVAYNLGAGGRSGAPESPGRASQLAEGSDHDHATPGETIWTCPMHPEIRMSEPGKCPICGMELVPQEVSPASPAAPSSTATAEPTPRGYACAMNCVPPLPNPGKCPICGMEMQPIYDDGPSAAGAGSDRRLVMSPEARALAAIQTSPVERRWVEHTLNMVGFIDHDETRLAYITAYVDGRLERLFVDYTGTLVREGDHMVEIYSPELLSTQEELFQAREASDRLKDSPIEGLRRSSRQSLESARERLRLWGLTPEQIQTIEESRQTQDRITIYAPIGGIVIGKNVQEGGYVKTGDRIYTLSDLNHLWVKLKAYENDLPWLRYGQDVIFKAEALPGEEFHGRISFISPTLDTMTRTVDVRVNVENEGGRLKPGMYVRARVKSRLTTGGKVLAPDLAGKWISPMHPEILKDGPGSCDVCGMALVPVEEMGFVAEAAGTPPLVIPATVPLITGKRAVVYVELPDAGRPEFEGREVVLGPRAGNDYIVIEGLQEGERVVTHGAFKIDSSLQIMAKPSMMNPEGGRAMTGHEGHGAEMPADPAVAGEAPAPDATNPHSGHETTDGPLDVSMDFRRRLTPLYQGYFAVQEALADDDFESAKNAYDRLHEAVNALRHDDLEGHAAEACVAQSQAIGRAATEGRAAPSIAEARRVFEPLSEAFIRLVRQFGHAGEQTIYLVYCPMAFNNKGADWLQTADDVDNPYFGAEMLTCGVVTQEFPPAAAAPDSRSDDQSDHNH